jgi:hypothetical protein
MPHGKPSPTWKKSGVTMIIPVRYVLIPVNCAQFVPEVGLFITNELELDIPSITGRLNDRVNEKWLVEEVGRDKVEHGVVSSSNLKVRVHNHS